MVDAQQQSSVLTRSQWTDILAAQVTSGEDSLIRREHERFYVVASAKLTPRMLGKPSGDEQQFCALLDVSETGLMVRSRTSIPAETPVDVDVYLGDGEYHLAGRVAHCTSSIGANKVGVRFEFPHDDPVEALDNE